MAETKIDETCRALINQVESSGKAFVDSVRTTSKDPMEFNKLAIIGMGGSGISGDYVTKLAEFTSDKRIIVNKSYQLPANIDGTWDAVVLSYSGNTEETLSCFTQLIKMGINPVCITSNGKLEDFAKEHNLNYINIPAGIAPRAAFPYLFGSLYGLVAKSLDLEIPSPEQEIQYQDDSKLRNKAHLDQLCNQLVNKFPIIVAPTELSNVALRFRCQINENSKKSAAHFVSPEFSHNAIVGFDGRESDDKALLLLRSNQEYGRTSLHLNFLRDEMDQVGLIHEFKVNGSSLLQQQLKMTWMLDYISIKLAQLQEIDPLGVPSIVRLKSLLKSN